MVAVLVSVLAFVGVTMLMRKRYDSNVPLLFYFFALPFTNLFERPIHPYILFGGLALALLLRFEFMGTGFVKLVAFLAGVGLCMMIYALLSETVV